MKPKRIAALFAASVAVCVIVAATVAIPANAVWNEDDAVHINPDNIENATLIVGTHLIYLGSLTNPVYDVALASAGESGQSGVYYKSELADGTWFDVTAAATLADITTGGIPVAKSEIAALFLTHHTKSDGKTYDLRTGQAVGLFDIRPLYDLEKLDELFPLKTQYDITRELQSDSAYGKLKIKLMRDFFSTNVHTSVTDACDAELAALQSYYDVLAANDGGSAEMETVQAVMSAVDAARRAEVFVIADEGLQKLATTLQSIADTEGDDESEGTTGSGPDGDLQAAVNDSLANVEDARNTAEGLMLASGVTVMSAARYAACRDLIDHARANNHAACDGDVERIMDFDNIQNGAVVNADRELGRLRDALLPAATAPYQSALAAGDNEAYKSAVSQNAAAALKNGIIRKAANELTILRSELEFFISAATERMDSESALAFTDARLDETQMFYTTVPLDDFSGTANDSIGAHIDFLTRLRRDIELNLGGNDADKLLARKAELQVQLLQALDDNDLAAAKRLQGDVSDMDDRLAGSPGGSGAATLAVASDLLQNARTASDDGSASDLMNNVEALGGLLGTNYAVVFPALENLHADLVKKRDLNGDTGLGDAIKAIEDLILNNRDAYNRAVSKSLSADDAQGVADAYFSGDTGGDVRLFDTGVTGEAAGAAGLTDDEKEAVLIAALLAFEDQIGDFGADGLMRARLQSLFESGSPIVFLALPDTAARYVPARNVAEYLHLRYVWNRNKNGGTIARGRAYWFYTVYSGEVVSGKSAADIAYMIAPARYKDGLYIPDDHTEEAFGVWGVLIPGTPYGVLLSERTDSCVAELVSRLLQAAGASN